MVLRTPSGRVVVQMAESSPNGAAVLAYQAEGLRQLWPLAPTLHIPRVWGSGAVATGEAYTVLEHVPNGPARRDFQRRFGRGLAQLHLAAVDYPCFGFPMDGAVGTVEQRNNAAMEPLDWVEFWREYRLGDQLRRIRAKYPTEEQQWISAPQLPTVRSFGAPRPNDAPVQKYGRMVLDRLPELFAGLDIQAIRPCALHGNLTAATIAADPSGHPILRAPAAYYGHNEADLGALRLSGGYTDDFWQAYHQLMPKTAGYARRVPLYKLHYGLNAYLSGDVVCRAHAVELLRQILDSLYVYYD